MQTIHEAALKTASQLTWRISTLIGSLLAIMVTLFVVWSTYFRVETGVTAVTEQISHLILVGDTFQLKTQLLSLASSGIIDHFLLKEPSGIVLAGNDIQEISQFDDSNFRGSQIEIGRIDGSFQVIRKFIVQGSGNRNSTLIVSKRLPLEIFVFMIFAIALVFFFTHRIFRRLIMNLAEDLTDPISDLASVVSKTQSYGGLEENEDLKTKLRYQELQLTLDSFLKLLRRLKTAEELRMSAEKEAALSQIATQVAHDIRSPVTALNVVSHTAKNLTEEERTLLRSATQRINDIANTLLLKNKNDESGLKLSQESKNSAVMLAPLLDSIVSEKRAALQNIQDIQLEIDISKGYGLFVKSPASDLSRVFSNLISNSIEAIEKSKGLVKISFRPVPEGIELSILDNGRGMPGEIVETLGSKQISYGKENSDSGSGLGFFYAKKTIEHLGGSVSVKSELGKGTTINIILSKCKPPTWFVESIPIKSNEVIVTVDDDPSVHQVWRRLFSDLIQQNPTFNLTNYTSTKLFESWLSSVPNLNATFFIDYEFSGESINGLDLIEKLGIAHNSILVSSIDDDYVRARAMRLGVKIIPKIMVPFIPLQIPTLNKQAALI